MEQQPHVLMFPFPAQGHVKPMLTLAQLLSHGGIHVTFLTTEHNHRLLISSRQSLSALFPTLHFESIPDGLPPDHPRSFYSIHEIASSLMSVTKPLLRELMLISLTKKEEHYETTTSCVVSTRFRPPLSCLMTDGVMCFAIDVAEELGIPTMAVRFISACAFWSYLCIPDLIQQGQLPLTDDDDMDERISSVPGMEGLLRRRDLPGFCRIPMDHPVARFLIDQPQASTRASSLIINTFDDLESSALSHITLRFPKIYTLGPLHGLLKSRINNGVNLSASLGQEVDRRCITWLNSQRSRSVIFVSFGSLVKLTRAQMVEFWHGLVSSGKQFLWVVRSDMILDEHDDDEIMGGNVVDKYCSLPSIFFSINEQKETKQGLIVEWAPQEEVLEHKAVGGFLTHSGWNSTLESIWAGVPMLCWPKLVDQPVNSRWVGEVWKIGIDMKDKCERSTVEKMVRTLMEESNESRELISKSVDRLSKLAHQAVREGGSSYNNLDKLIQDLKNL